MKLTFKPSFCSLLRNKALIKLHGKQKIIKKHGIGFGFFFCLFVCFFFFFKHTVYLSSTFNLIEFVFVVVVIVVIFLY